MTPTIKTIEQIKEHLKNECDKLFNDDFTIKEQFISADSFSFLLSSVKAKIVAKVFKYPNWPPKGKIELISNLLKSHNIEHEETLYLDYSKKIFDFGWTVSRFIEGGIAKYNLENKLLNEDIYYIKTGALLSKVHEIKMDYFGNINSRPKKFKDFKSFFLYSLTNPAKKARLKDSHPNIHSICIKAHDWLLDNENSIEIESAVLIHNDVNLGNVIWHENHPILIDWVDALACPSTMEFAAMTFRVDNSILPFIEEGYGHKINLMELKFFQTWRLLNLVYFYFEEDMSEKDTVYAGDRLEKLMQRELPFGV